MQIGQRFKHATVGLRLFDYIFVLTRNYTDDTNTASKENYELPNASEVFFSSLVSCLLCFSLIFEYFIFIPEKIKLHFQSRCQNSNNLVRSLDSLRVLTQIIKRSFISANHSFDWNDFACNINLTGKNNH